MLGSASRRVAWHGAGGCVGPARPGGVAAIVRAMDRSTAHAGTAAGNDGDAPGPALRLSVVAPAHNEEGNIAPLVDEVEEAIGPLGIAWEFIVVDDGSTDRTREILLGLMVERPWLRCVAMQNTPAGKGNGQSAAFHAGFRAARGALIAVLDADLQNDPADLPAMLEKLEAEGADFVQGDRSRVRQDGFVRRVGSKVGRWFRRMLLGDTIRDTGCSLRVFRREIGLALPLEFKGMHRFIPATVRILGGSIAEMRVSHRARHSGSTKYGLGLLNRGVAGFVDCLAVRWMSKRVRDVSVEEVGSGGEGER